MADREEKLTAKAVAAEEEDSSASEYEEIIEEVTDYSEDEAEEVNVVVKAAANVKQTTQTKAATKVERQTSAGSNSSISSNKSKLPTATIDVATDNAKSESPSQLQSSTTTERIETKADSENGAVATTITKVTTRTVSGKVSASKDISSPFAKFQQLERENSQQSPKTSK